MPHDDARSHLVDQASPSSPPPSSNQGAKRRDDGAPHAYHEMAAGAERPGHQVVLGLFVVLALCVVFIFTVFALAVRPEDREWVPELTARYLYMPIVATSLIIAIDAYRLGSPRWWWFLVTAPVPVVNIVLAAMWLMRWRDAPTTSA